MFTLQKNAILLRLKIAEVDVKDGDADLPSRKAPLLSFSLPILHSGVFFPLSYWVECLWLFGSELRLKTTSA